jgi:hypothetical protein
MAEVKESCFIWIIEEKLEEYIVYWGINHEGKINSSPIATVKTYNEAIKVINNFRIAKIINPNQFGLTKEAI